MPATAGLAELEGRIEVGSFFVTEHRGGSPPGGAPSGAWNEITPNFVTGAQQKQGGLAEMRDLSRALDSKAATVPFAVDAEAIFVRGTPGATGKTVKPVSRGTAIRVVGSAADGKFRPTLRSGWARMTDPVNGWIDASWLRNDLTFITDEGLAEQQQAAEEASKRTSELRGKSMLLERAQSRAIRARSPETVDRPASPELGEMGASFGTPAGRTRHSARQGSWVATAVASVAPQRQRDSPPPTPTPTPEMGLRDSIPMRTEPCMPASAGAARKDASPKRAHRHEHRDRRTRSQSSRPRDGTARPRPASGPTSTRPPAPGSPGPLLAVKEPRPQQGPQSPVPLAT